MHTSEFSVLPDTGDFRSHFLNGSQGPLILSHGRLSPTKGLDLLIDALHVIRQEHQTAILALVGADSQGLKSELIERARGYGLTDSVFFPGELVGNDLLSALAACQVWASASHTENFGLAAAEAMAAGKAVVASKAINMAPDAYADGAIMMVDVDSASIASAITDLLGSPSRRKELGQRGKQYVKRYDWQTIAGRYLDLYRFTRALG
jgi:glycosyltransferase involved in cell wall biosynthesis